MYFVFRSWRLERRAADGQASRCCSSVRGVCHGSHNEKEIECHAFFINGVMSGIACTCMGCGTGSIPKELTRLFFLQRLHLDNNKLSGELHVLHVSGRIRGEALMYFVVESDRLVLRVATRYEGTGTPAARGKWPVLCVLGIIESHAALVDNVLGAVADTGMRCDTGSIPKELGELCRLKELQLQNNELRGKS